MNKHTPGPWQVGPAYDNDGIAEVIIEHKTEHGNLVVAVALGGLVGQAENANLIAAAPDLLKALQAAVTATDVVTYGAALDKARAAIAKATGEHHG